MAYIEVTDLEKVFTVRKKRENSRLLREKTQVKALDGVSFTVDEGELVGYIGPNGAGKSTTVKILSGILTPDGGSARVGGLTPWKERKKHVRRIGVVFGQRTQLWWDVPVEESYRLLRDIYRVPQSDYAKRLTDLTDALNLGGILKTPLRLLSLGQRMRAELAGSLLHGPELLFLDEPSIGLDAVSKLNLRAFLKEQNRRFGTTVMLTTHDMEDIQALCSRVMVLGHGKKLFDGALTDLLSRYDTRRVAKVRFSGEADFTRLPAECEISRDGDLIKIAYAPDSLPAARLLEALQAAGPIRELTLEPQNVDAMIADMYREMDL